MTQAGDAIAGEAVRRALASVDGTAYTVLPGGARMPHLPDPAVVAGMLERLEVGPGHRVLEVGTGSGFSAAVLSRLVGPGGQVTSIDIEARLSRRAARLLADDGCGNVRLVTGDGTRWAPDSRYDRVIAWVAPVRIPDVWVRQAVPGAVLVSPVHLAPLARAMGVARLRRGATPDQLTADLLMPGGFAEARPEPQDQWPVPSYGVDALTRDAAGRMWWVAAEWLRAHEPVVGMRLLELMITDGRGGAGWPGAVDLHAYLMAARPDGLTTASLGAHGWGVGCSEPGGVALLCPSGDLFLAGTPAALDRLGAWTREWREHGQPGMSGLTPRLHRRGSGWDVRAVVPPR
ncbi:protein-L-isoaspartate O-methyltransferase family protein [Nonomuraea gerenzanensis]|uniref:Protein-L-isoaspartate O-methyltransferase n=1 Tax=Nonomuraea gerenzanensis TaxID=93944 RepID=A0A1M4ER28_9ACTN|nr:methyltransferase domain-containing protein [Nonomuraea gerenzanensis]UBU12743.1 methyltransferase domain-containing protein [Nonomuraea gerenzanensis]SBP01299.1 Protein-L-isoaspartate O-methyltransferase [Nonomuraea gerenzanensis]